jgi:hypothetical protein
VACAFFFAEGCSAVRATARAVPFFSAAGALPGDELAFFAVAAELLRTADVCARGGVRGDEGAARRVPDEEEDDLATAEPRLAAAAEPRFAAAGEEPRFAAEETAPRFAAEAEPRLAAEVAEPRLAAEEETAPRFAADTERLAAGVERWAPALLRFADDLALVIKS